MNIEEEIEKLIEKVEVEIAKNRTLVECFEEGADSTFMDSALSKTERNVTNGRERFVPG